jgi:hypothetical protein
MKLSTFAAVLSLLLAPVHSFAEGAPESPAPIAIYMSFDGAHSAQAVAAMQSEVASLTKRSLLNLRWIPLDGPRSDESFSDLMVVKLHGNCNMEGIQFLFNELGLEGDGGALGSTSKTDNHVLPFSELQCDRIRRSIAPLAIGNTPNEREALLGRAMGRVLAHELFHIFANTDKHGREGVAKTKYTRKDLVADRFEFDAKDAQRMDRR